MKIYNYINWFINLIVCDLQNHFWLSFFNIHIDYCFFILFRRCASLVNHVSTDHSFLLCLVFELSLFWIQNDINQFETAIMKKNNFIYFWNKCFVHMNLFSLFLVWIHYKIMKIYRIIINHDEWHFELKSFWVNNFIRCKWNFLIFTFLNDATFRDSLIDSELMFKSRFKSWLE